MAGNSLQYVTLVVQGGTPIRLANQMGAPYPTTGRGALVFAESPIIDNPTFTGTVVISQGQTVGVGVGAVASPSLFFGNVLNKDGLYSESLHHVDVTVNGVKVADFGPGLLTVYDNIKYNGTLTGGSASFTNLSVATFAIGAVSITGVLTGTSANFSGIVTSTASPAGFIVSGPAATIRNMGAATTNILRWSWGANATAEGAGTVGSDYVIRAYNNVGALLSTPVTITRSSGAVALTGALTGAAATFSGNLAVTGTITKSNTVDGTPGLATSIRWYDGGGGLINGLGTSASSFDLRSNAQFNWFSGATPTKVAMLASNTLTIYGSGAVANVILSHDNTNAHLRPANAGSSLFLGAASIDHVVLSSTGMLSPNADVTQSLGTATNRWLTLHTRSVTFYGSTSGTSTLQAPAIAGATTITLPSATGTLANLTVIGVAPPASPAIGQQWWSFELGQMFIWYDDGTTTQWVSTSLQ